MEVLADAVESDFQCHQPEYEPGPCCHCGVIVDEYEDSPHDCVPVPTEAEKFFASVQRIKASELPAPSLTPRRPSGKEPAKRPMVYVEDEEDSPDLARFFDEFDFSVEKRIKFCRAYATYLATTLPKAPKRAKVSRKK